MGCISNIEQTSCMPPKNHSSEADDAPSVEIYLVKLKEYIPKKEEILLEREYHPNGRLKKAKLPKEGAWRINRVICIPDTVIEFDEQGDWARYTPRNDTEVQGRRFHGGIELFLKGDLLTGFRYPKKFPPSSTGFPQAPKGYLHEHTSIGGFDCDPRRTIHLCPQDSYSKGEQFRLRECISGSRQKVNGVTYQKGATLKRICPLPKNPVTPPAQN